MQRFRGGLVFQAHRLLYHLTLGMRVIKKKREDSRVLEGKPKVNSLCRTAVFKSQVRLYMRLKNDQPLFALWRGNAPEREGNNLQYLRPFSWKPRPESGLDCLMCAIFARYRSATPSYLRERINSSLSCKQQSLHSWIIFITVEHLSGTFVRMKGIHECII